MVPESPETVKLSKSWAWDERDAKTLNTRINTVISFGFIYFAVAEFKWWGLFSLSIYIPYRPNWVWVKAFSFHLLNPLLERSKSTNSNELHGPSVAFSVAKAAAGCSRDVSPSAAFSFRPPITVERTRLFFASDTSRPSLVGYGSVDLQGT